MPSDLDKSYGGYSTFRPQRNAEGEEETEKECQDNEESGCEEAERELLAKWFAQENGK